MWASYCGVWSKELEGSLCDPLRTSADPFEVFMNRWSAVGIWEGDSIDSHKGPAGPTAWNTRCP